MKRLTFAAFVITLAFLPTTLLAQSFERYDESAADICQDQSAEIVPMRGIKPRTWKHWMGIE